MSKSFAGVAILQLRDQGKLQLDEPAQLYIPELSDIRYPTNDAPPITIRHLLTHAAGFPEDNPWGGVAGAQYPVHAPYGFNGGFYYARVGYKF